MSDMLDTTVREIEARLKELRPAVAEHERLRAARDALTSLDEPTKRTRRTRSRAPSSRRRRRGGGSRSAEALAVVTARPGLTIREIAEVMGIGPNYLYRILPSLEQEGQVRREGKGWKAGSAA